MVTMTDNHEAEPMQKTDPKKGDPVEIPIPTRDAFLRDLEKVAPPSSSREDADSR